MSVKIRLQRHGKKQKPFYWIVAADARSKRDGKFLEKLGIYNPNTNPATVDLNLDKAVQWLHNGAQPTDTARAILATWLESKASKVDAKKDGLSKAQQAAKAKAFKAEQEANEKRIKAAADALKAEEAVEEVAEEVAEEVVAEVASEEVVAEEAPATEGETTEEAEA
jgi:small subunit ribosomal protein S16